MVGLGGGAKGRTGSVGEGLEVLLPALRFNGGLAGFRNRLPENPCFQGQKPSANHDPDYRRDGKLMMGGACAYAGVVGLFDLC